MKKGSKLHTSILQYKIQNVFLNYANFAVDSSASQRVTRFFTLKKTHIVLFLKILNTKIHIYA